MAKSESQHTRHVGGVVMTEPNRANSAHARQIYYQPLDVALLLRTYDGLYKTGYKIASIFINKILCSVEALYMYAILWCMCYYWRYRKNIFFKIFARRLSIQKPAIDCQTECQRVAQRPLRICG